MPTSVHSENPATFSYIPSVNGKPYDFSNKNSFKLMMEPITESQAKQALRIFVDFIKQEVESVKYDDLESAMLFEPMLTHLLSMKHKYLL